MPTPLTLPPRNLGVLKGTPSGAPSYAFTHANPLDPEFAQGIARDTSLVAWAGWFDADANPERGSFPSDHRLWTTGLDALRGAIARLDPVLREREALFYVRPALGLVLSDPHSVAALLKEPPSERLRVLVDPVAMLTPEMASHAEEHLSRMFDKLGHFEACSAIVLAGYKGTSDDRVGHQTLTGEQPFVRTLLKIWRESAFAEREVFVLTDDCRALIEAARIA